MTGLSDAVSADTERDAVATRERRRFNPLARRLPWWGETLVAVAFYWLYDAVQALTQSDADEATAHGADVVRAEKAVHIWAEPNVNHWATHHNWLALIAGYDYALAHVFVTAAVLAYLWWRHPEIEVGLRNAIVGMSLVALVVYWQFPVSPPRFVVAGLTDTLIKNDILGARHVHEGLVNLYAAMPSLHVAWAVWCAAALVLALRSAWRHLAWLYPCWTTFVVVSTANHYFLDAFAGLVLAIVPLAIVTFRWPRSADSPASSTSAHPIPSRPS
ncbi:MAG TPA: phosphatase PAP2 family protein [Mycobacteriales bacterium]|nr:phosphatase PAP2 family protein [Mycobacteriales bacterium]